MPQEMAILTPEKTIVSYQLAGLGSRTIAHLLDFVIIVAAVILINMLLILVIGLGDPTVASAVAAIVASLGPFAYFILFEGLWNGQTIGKKAAGIRVRMADGTPLIFSAALGRNFVRVADFLPAMYFLGVASMFTNPRSQRLGDMLANTIVIHDRVAEPIFMVAPHALHVHPLEDRVGDLPGLTPEEYQALRRLCDRFPELSPLVQERLIREVWTPISSLRGIPTLPGIHPLYVAEAVVMKYGRTHGLI